MAFGDAILMMSINVAVRNGLSVIENGSAEGFGSKNSVFGVIMMNTNIVKRAKHSKACRSHLQKLMSGGGHSPGQRRDPQKWWQLCSECV